MTATGPVGAIRILVADDHPVTRDGLCAVLKRSRGLAVIAEAGNGREAVDLYAAHRPQVAVLDLRMPVMDGFEATRRIIDLDPDANVLILTSYDGDADVRRAVQTGARGYLFKDAPREAIWSAVRTAANGGTVLGPGAAALLAESVRSPELSPRECETLRLLAQGLSNKEIAARMHVSGSTAKTHVVAVLSKLGVSTRTEAAAVAARRGLLRD